MDEKAKVFVYGTLLEGEHNNYLLASSEKLGNVTVSGFQMYDLGPFPACRQSENAENKIKGEVWEVNAETLERLDYLEGHPYFYRRVEVGTEYGLSWIYIFERERSGAILIKSGDWRNRK